MRNLLVIILVSFPLCVQAQDKKVQNLCKEVLAHYKAYQQKRTLQDLRACYAAVKVLDTLTNTLKTGLESEKEKLKIATLTNQAYEVGIQASLQLWEFREAFYFAERNKSSILLQEILKNKTKKSEKTLTSLFSQEQVLKDEIAALNQSFEKSDKSEFQVKNWQESLFNLQEKENVLMKKLQEEYPTYRYSRNYDPLELIFSIQEKLDEETALIEYIVAEKSVSIFVLTRQGFNASTIAIDSAFFSEIKTFRNSIYYQAQGNVISKGIRLYNKLLKVNIPEKISNVVIVADDLLASIPFESMVIDADSTGKNPTYLIEKYNVSYAYSALLYIEQITKKVDSYSFLGIAPVFSEESASASKRSSQPSYLPNTETELISIAKLFHQNKTDVDIYSHQQATEERLKYNSSKDYRYIHIATHGFVNMYLPDSSGIHLAKLENSKEDGIIYASELYNMEFNADIITLSACETGLGQINSGEGVIGLTRALMYAGAKNVLVSLWKVDDAATAELMIQFYKNVLEGKSNAMALREAKLHLLKSPKFKNPVYWSPFILVGQ